MQDGISTADGYYVKPKGGRRRTEMNSAPAKEGQDLRWTQITREGQGGEVTVNTE